MRGPRLAALCAFAGLLLLAVVVARGTTAVPSSPREIEPPPFRPTQTGVGGPLPNPAVPTIEMREFSEPPDTIRSGVLFVVLVLVAGAVLIILLRFAYLARRRRRVWLGPVAVEGELGSALPPGMREAMERARAELVAREGGPPEDAVVAAWLILERAAEREGVARRPHQTPTEFTAALLGGEYTTDAAALDELRGLYQRARFGNAPVTDEDVRRARDALDQVLARA